MSRVVHFTHHQCVVGGLSAPFPPTPWAPGPGRAATMHGRLPDWGCPRPNGSARSSLRGGVHTLDVRRVTCRWCTRRLERHARPADGWRSNDELVELAWFHCCRNRGVASPVSFARTAELIAQADAAKNAAAADEFLQRFSIAGVLMAAVMKPESARAEFDDLVRSLLGDARVRLQPAIDEVTMALDLLVEVSTMCKRAESISADFANAIRGGEIAAPAMSRPRGAVRLAALTVGDVESLNVRDSERAA